MSKIFLAWAEAFARRKSDYSHPVTTLILCKDT